MRWKAATSAGVISSPILAAVGVSQVLNHKLPLTLRMIPKLHDGLGIPAEVLINEPQK